MWPASRISTLAKCLARRMKPARSPSTRQSCLGAALKASCPSHSNADVHLQSPPYMLGEEGAVDQKLFRISSDLCMDKNAER